MWAVDTVDTDRGKLPGPCLGSLHSSESVFLSLSFCHCLFCHCLFVFVIVIVSVELWTLTGRSCPALAWALSPLHSVSTLWLARHTAAWTLACAGLRHSLLTPLPPNSTLLLKISVVVFVFLVFVCLSLSLCHCLFVLFFLFFFFTPPFVSADCNHFEYFLSHPLQHWKVPSPQNS